jgi:hypothetical protein
LLSVPLMLEYEEVLKRDDMRAQSHLTVAETGHSWRSGHRLHARGTSHRARTVYSGSRVDCQATICHCPPLLT